jgi:DNA-binding HxlR family transcriptional regulator
MRTYGQHCVIAKALDVVGDRWTLLIVRELLLQGPCRFTDLRHGLPGIATNLLSARIKELEEAGLIYREAAPPPVATTLFHLTDDGRELEPVLEALGVWGVRYIAAQSPEEVFRAHWLTYPLRWFLHDNQPSAGAQTIQLVADDEPVALTVDHGTITPRVGLAQKPDVTLVGGPDQILGLLTGMMDAASAKEAGLAVSGNTRVLTRVRPTTLHPALAAAAGRMSAS